MNGNATHPTLEVLIVGAGFAGIGMGLSLVRSSIRNFVILDEGAEVGGTWRDNVYPGAACDVESHLYSYSFAPNPAWSRVFSPQGEILDYIKRCVAESGLNGHIRLRERVSSAEWDESTATWHITTESGSKFCAKNFIVATGGLSRPAFPDIPGLDQFQGALFHSARWKGAGSDSTERIGLIGTGASAIQIIPQLAGRCRELHIFQRSAHWVLPKADGAISRRELSFLRKFPVFTRFFRTLQYIRHESLVLGFIRAPGLLRIGEWIARRYLQKSVSSPLLRQKLTPHFRMGCKRILLSNDYFQALQKPGVELHTDGISCITKNGVMLKDGRAIAFDTLILATGFQASEAAVPFSIRGRQGTDLSSVWANGPEAYRGTTVHGFPNLFMIVGPNTGLGHSSMLLMIEAQVEYIKQALQLLRTKNLRSLEVSREAQSNYQDWLRKRFPKTVWSTGCKSWYLTRDGRNTTLWPGTTFGFARLLKRFDLEKYEALK